MTHKTLFRDVCFSTNIHKQERERESVCVFNRAVTMPPRSFGVIFFGVIHFFSIPSVV